MKHRPTFHDITIYHITINKLYKSNVIKLKIAIKKQPVHSPSSRICNWSDCN